MCFLVLFYTRSNWIWKIFKFIWSIVGTLTDTTSPGQSGPGINGNKGIFQNRNLTIRCSLVSYPFFGMGAVGSIKPSAGNTVNLFQAPLTTVFSVLKTGILRDIKFLSFFFFLMSFSCYFIFFNLHIFNELNYSLIIKFGNLVSSWFLMVGWVLWHINLCRLFNARSIFM